MVGLCFQVRKVTSNSMSETLLDGDLVIMAECPTIVGRALGTSCNPRRGDIIVFRAKGGDKVLIKRVVGIAGDGIRMRQKKLSINGVLVTEPYLHPADNRFEFNDGLWVADVKDQDSPDVLVKEGTIFVLGDNRGNSLDSRQFGLVQRSSIEGIAWLRVPAAASMPSRLSNVAK